MDAAPLFVHDLSVVGFGARRIPVVVFPVYPPGPHSPAVPDRVIDGHAAYLRVCSRLRLGVNYFTPISRPLPSALAGFPRSPRSKHRGVNALVDSFSETVHLGIGRS